MSGVSILHFFPIKTHQGLYPLTLSLARTKSVDTGTDRPCGIKDCEEIVFESSITGVFVFLPYNRNNAGIAN